MSEISPAQRAAEAEAEKRERHKSPGLTGGKRWQAVHTSTRGWHVALVDSPQQASFEAHAKARNALRMGDPAFFELAAEAMIALCSAQLAEIPSDAADTPA